LAFSLRYRKAQVQEGIMQMAITFMAVVGGMVFSLAVALLAEEFILGQVIRLFFVRQTVSAKTEDRR
jgi:ABC-type enterobactin transport system permease subunit